LFEDVIFRLAVVRVTACHDNYRWVVGHVVYKVPVAEGMRHEARPAGVVWRGRGLVGGVSTGWDVDEVSWGSSASEVFVTTESTGRRAAKPWVFSCLENNMD
jgi:hypothetical protein